MQKIPGKIRHFGSGVQEYSCRFGVKIACRNVQGREDAKFASEKLIWHIVRLTPDIYISTCLQQKLHGTFRVAIKHDVSTITSMIQRRPMQRIETVFGIELVAIRAVVQQYFENLSIIGDIGINHKNMALVIHITLSSPCLSFLTQDDLLSNLGQARHFLVISVNHGNAQGNFVTFRQCLHQMHFLCWCG